MQRAIGKASSKYSASSQTSSKAQRDDLFSSAALFGPPGRDKVADRDQSALSASTCLLPLSRSNVERYLRHFEVHRSMCGRYAQQRFVHRNRELAWGGRFVGSSVTQHAIDPAVALPAIDPAVS